VGCISVNISLVDNAIVAKARLVNQPLIATISKVNDGLKVNIGLVCMPNTEVYLRVTPKVIWLTPDTTSADFMVRSNTKWIIE
jgi:hypothetical protein